MLKIVKRLFDLFFATLGLLILFPLVFFIGLLIFIFMQSPVLFKQQRVGKKGSLFILLKFRSMLNANDVKKGKFDAGDNSRITSLGRFLRKTKLDELPQLLNVLKGEMSFVGPRPEVKQWTEVYPEKWRIVHSVKPGITDNASIEFRNEEEILAQSDDPVKTYREIILPRKLDLYIDYVNNQSFLGDLKIIFRTIKVVIKG